MGQRFEPCGELSALVSEVAVAGLLWGRPAGQTLCSLAEEPPARVHGHAPNSALCSCSWRLPSDSVCPSQSGEGVAVHARRCRCMLSVSEFICMCG